MHDAKEPRVLFLCGDRSPFGLALLRPVLDQFRVEAVVTATGERWQVFRESLHGGPLPSSGRLRRGMRAVRSVVRHAVPHRFWRSRRVGEIARQHGSAWWQVSDVNDADFVKRVSAMSIDLILCAAYPQILSGAVIAAPGLGAVNFHPSLLPAYRGAHPVFWAIADGASESGVTAHFMTERIDDGDVICRIPVPVDGCTYSELYKRILDKSQAIVAGTRSFFRNGSLPATPQPAEGVSLYRNDRPIHRRIFWNRLTASQIGNLCRTERAFCFFRGRRVVCLDVRVTRTNDNLTNGVVAESGTIVDVSGGSVAVQARDGVVEIGAIRSGRRPVPSARWVARRRPSVGEKVD